MACGDEAPPAGGSGSGGTPPADAGGEGAAGAASPWIAEIALAAPHKIGGCAVGDADPDRPGLEIVAVDIAGDVHLIYRDGDGWGHEVIARTGGEKIQCAIGPLDGVFEGSTIAVVGVAEGTEDDGGAGSLVLVGKGADGWEHRPFGEAYATLLHGVTIADVDPDVSGPELAVTGFDRKVWLYAFEDGQAELRTTMEIQGPGKALAGWPGILFVAQAGPWPQWIEVTGERESAGGSSFGYALKEVRGDWGPTARVAATPDGSQLLLAADDGRLWWRADDASVLPTSDRAVHEEPQKLRGAAIGDFDPTDEGLELATAGYAGKVTVLVPRGGGLLDAHVVYEDDKRLHHLAAGDVLPDAAGDELVACGYSGRIVVVRRR